jgi:hypothetical protein
MAGSSLLRRDVVSADGGPRPAIVEQELARPPALWAACGPGQFEDLWHVVPSFPTVSRSGRILEEYGL